MKSQHYNESILGSSRERYRRCFIGRIDSSTSLIEETSTDRLIVLPWTCSSVSAPLSSLSSSLSLLIVKAASTRSTYSWYLSFVHIVVFSYSPASSSWPLSSGIVVYCSPSARQVIFDNSARKLFLTTRGICNKISFLFHSNPVVVEIFHGCTDSVTHQLQLQ